MLYPELKNHVVTFRISTETSALIILVRYKNSRYITTPLLVANCVFAEAQSDSKKKKSGHTVQRITIKNYYQCSLTNLTNELENDNIRKAWKYMYKNSGRMTKEKMDSAFMRTATIQ